MTIQGAPLITQCSGARVLRVVGRVLLGLVIAELLTGCADSLTAAPEPPTTSYTPYTPTPPDAVDLRSASQALSLQISAKGVPVDGLKCRADGARPTSMQLHCTVITGGGPDHPDQLAEGTWNRSAGTVRLISVAAAPPIPEAPLASVAVKAADDVDIDSTQVTRIVRPALMAAGALTRTDELTCGALHSSVAGCEAHKQGAADRYFNVVLRDAKLPIYFART